MQKKYTVGLLISTYNWPQALQLTLESLLRQTVMPDEVIIADDGSTKETKNLIETYTAHIAVPVKHIWHEDNGFQLSQIRNKAIAAANSDYIIQIDGDVVMQKNFIKDHLKARRNGYFVMGSRANLPQLFSKKILQQTVLPSNFKMQLHTSDFLNAQRIPLLSPLFTNYKTKGKNLYYAKGCNMAFWKEDIICVNGYNENFTGWGAEDKELVVRLIKYGVKKKFLKFGGVVYHLWHSFNSRDSLLQNNLKFEEAVKSNSFLASKGISQYL